MIHSESCSTISIRTNNVMAVHKAVKLSFIGLMPIFIGVIWKLMISKSTVNCDDGHFMLPGMTRCHPHLNCRNINEQIVVKEVIGRGAVKLVKRGEWQNHSVAVNILANTEYIDDFLHGLYMLQHLQSKASITQLVGKCEEQQIFITQFYPLGSADRLEQILNQDHFHVFNTLSVRFSLCQNYVKILHSLHTSADGARVMCDSNDVNKTLSQFLLGDDFTLILNDVDALPLVDKTRGQLVKCGHRELFGEFVAPEQLWPYEDRDFSDDDMPGYDEKVDIWKVPDVCEALLGSKGSGKLQLQLLSVHLKCKSVDSSERPSALEVLKAYENISNKLLL